MDVNIVKEALIAQRKIGLNGSLYHKTQIEFAYNTNHIEGSTITPDETASIYDTGTILTSSDKVIVLKDATETKNHFTLFKYMLDTIEEPLTEDMIKKFHFILKDGTLTDSEKEWFNIGEYKKKKNFVGDITTSLPKDVAKDMKKLLDSYNKLTEKKLEDIIDFHVKFERIHPFQDGNGRLSRALTALLLLKSGYSYVPYSSMESIIESSKGSYYMTLRETQKTIWDNQVNYQPWLEFFITALYKQKQHLEEKIKQIERTADLSKNARAVLDLFNGREELTSREISLKTNINIETVRKILQKLLKRGDIKRYGTTCTSSYQKTEKQ